MISLRTLIYVMLVSSLIFSCGKKESDKTALEKTETDTAGHSITSAGIKEGSHEFSVEYSMPRRIYKIEKKDLNNDGGKEVIVLSVSKDPNDKFNDYYNFDMMEIFALDQDKQKYVKTFSDTVDYSEDCFFIDLAGDSTNQILITTNSGGNDKIMSEGMFVYSMNSSNSIELLKYFDTGSPEVTDLNNDGRKEILVSDLFYGVMPQPEAVSFVKEIYKFEKGKLVRSNGEFQGFYEDKLKELLENYRGLKKKVESGMQLADLSFPLYREASEVIVNYYAKGDMKGLKKFWDEEMESLKRNIQPDEFIDLNNFVTKALPAGQNA